MAQEFGGTVGKQQYGRAVSGRSLRQETSGGLIVSKYLADYGQAVIDGIAFSAANQAAQAVSVGLATSYTGLLLYNPVGSNVIVIPKFVKVGLAAAPAAAANIGLIAGSSVLSVTTPLTVRSNQIGGAVPSAANAFSIATLAAAPVWLMPLVDAFTAAAFPPATPPIDLKGAFQLMPGGFIGIGASAAISMFGGFVWDELPLTSA